MYSTVAFHGDLAELLSAEYGERPLINYDSQRHASIKDVIESLGVPHTEVGRIVANGEDVPFSYLLEEGDRIEVYPLVPPVDPTTPTLLRPFPLSGYRFVADVNVGRLARLLRMAGFDTLFKNCLSDEELARISAEKGRILLSRDRRLLKRRIVTFGHLVRAEDPRLQLAEVIRFYGLERRSAPFTRCMVCNGVLVSVPKSEVMDRLEPLTKRYYENFYLCPDCGKIYWSGSHKEAMLRVLQNFVFGNREGPKEEADHHCRPER